MEILTLTTILQYLIDIDTNVFLAINSHHTPYWDTFMYFFSDRKIWVPLYLSLIFVLARNSDWRKIAWCTVALGCMFLFTDMFAASVVRPWVARLRPSNLNNPLSSVVHIVGNYRSGRFGFPSSHAANCWALAFFCWYLFRHKAITIFLSSWALLTCYSRSYLGVHYPGDLLAGIVFGFTGATVVYYAFKRISGHEHYDNLKYAYVPVFVGMITITVFFLVSAFVRI